MVALGVAIVGLFAYVAGGYLMLQLGVLNLSYPFLVVNSDPVLLFLTSAGGLFITIAMLGLIFSVMLRPGPEEDTLVIVLLGSIAVGFGISAFYYGFILLVRLVG